jgi:glycosyltransferase involved in cell wall biosynthesis
MVAYTDYPSDTRVRREAEALVERGDTVDVICLGDRDEANPEYKNGVRMIKISFPHYQGTKSGRYMAAYLYFFCAALLKLTKMHFKYSYQVIQVHTMPDFLVFTAIVPKLLGAKVILDVHDLMPELYQSKFGSNKRHLFIRFLKWVERRSISFADRAIAVHQPHLEALCSHGNPSQKFIVLLNLPDMKIFTNQRNNQPQGHPGLELIYHGMVAKRNGLEIAIQAISTLRDDFKQLKLKIIGDGDDILRLSELVTELGLLDMVQIVRCMMPIEKLVPIINDADVGIVPILNDEFTRYMLPTKLLEYVAMGKPVICSRTATIEAFFNDTMVLFVTPGNVSELAEAIRELYEHPEKRKQLSEAASQFTWEYNWEKQKQTYYQLIDSLVNK